MRRLAWIAALVVGNLTIASAEEILVPAADRDRIIKMSDGRQVRLPAGRELIRADDGRILARHRTTPQSDARQGGSLVRPPAPTQKQLARALPDGAKMPVDRWAYYVSLFGASRSVSRKHDIKTDNLCAIDSNCEITYEGAKFKADGRSVSLDKTKTETSFGGSLG
ncbi:MAG: hypothetical protein LBU73_06960, partial [Helicobacteraceae bacterium]|nr:hypothetical protein [Helicobacteraceae bacterium]